MKKLLACAIAFAMAFSVFGSSLIIRNNTNQRMKVSVWLSGVGFWLDPGQEIEFEMSRDYVNFDCKYGVALVYNEKDTTLELNDDCYYVGEARQEYWNEY